MVFLKRLGTLVYVFLMVVTGAVMTLISIRMFTLDQWTIAMETVNGTFAIRAALGAVGGIFVFLGVIAPFRLERNIKKNRVLAFQNPDGEVTVSLSAIEEYIRRIAKDIVGIRDIRPHVWMSRKGVDIRTDVSLTAGANIPEITEKIQREVKGKIHGMLGVEENVNIRMHVRKITKGFKVKPSSVVPDEEEMIPYRESR
ncbi:MAG: alkaline shock response membrane anchor protein AmaP [Candidatus Omnitrophota bacterium]